MSEMIDALAKNLASTQGFAWDLLTDELEDDGPNMCRQDFRIMAQAALAFVSANGFAEA